MSDTVVVEVPVDAKVTFFESSTAGAAPLEDIALPFTVPDGRPLSALIERPGRKLQHMPALAAGTVFQYEARPNDPDELADFEERLVRGEQLRQPRVRSGWDVRLGS